MRLLSLDVFYSSEECSSSGGSCVMFDLVESRTIRER